MKKRQEQAAFTLIELMIVVIIIAALAAMVAPNLMDRTDDAKAKIARGDISNIDVSLKLYRLDNGSYPTSEQGLDALLVRPGSAPNWKGPYLERKALDPWKNPYKYVCPGSHSAAGFDLFSTGKDGQEGTADDISNWAE